MRKFGGIVLVIIMCCVAGAPADATSRSVVDPKRDAFRIIDFTNVTFTNSGDQVRAEITVPGLADNYYGAYSVNVGPSHYPAEYDDDNFFASAGVIRKQRIDGTFETKTFFRYYHRGGETKFDVPCPVSTAWSPATDKVTVGFSIACYVKWTKTITYVSAFGLDQPTNNPTMWVSSDSTIALSDPSTRYDRSQWVNVAHD